VVRKRTPTKFSNNFNDYKESPMFTYVACEFWLNRVLAQVNSIAAKRSRQRWSQKRVYSRMVVFSTNISMSLRVTAPRNRRKNSQQVVEENHFELIRETFERTTEATSDLGLVLHTADCCWWGDWRIEEKSPGLRPHILAAFWTFIVISDLGSPLLTLSC